ncbi:MAG: peptidyl-tRNA hydrolase [Fimbriimonadales bacterium]
MLFGRRSGPTERPEWLIVGLGNPGMQYSHTRHNIGFRAATLLAERHKIKLRTRKFKALYGYGEIENTPVVIALPMTYMNLSGNAVQPLLRHYDLGPDRLLVLADDLALPLGRIRIRLRGSGGGQRGLEHIIQTLGTEEFARLRIGIDPANPGQAVEHVLSPFHREEQPVVKEVLERVVAAVRMWLRDGPEKAMNEFNRKSD